MRLSHALAHARRSGVKRTTRLSSWGDGCMHLTSGRLCDCAYDLCCAAKVEIMGPKVELSLVKADGTEWERLGDFVENGESS